MGMEGTCSTPKTRTVKRDYQVGDIVRRKDQPSTGTWKVLQVQCDNVRITPLTQKGRCGLQEVKPESLTLAPEAPQVRRVQPAPFVWCTCTARVCTSGLPHY